MCCQDTPDTTGINKAAEANANVAQQALDWYKQQYNDQAPLRQQAIDTAQKVSDAQLAAMGTATSQAQKDQQYREQVFQPLEKGIVSDAEGYDTVDRENQAAGKAMADVTLAAAGARASGARDLTRSGVNPSDGAYGAMEREADLGTALGQVDAANRARTQVQTLGRAMKMDAASLGRGLPSSQATQASLALTAGNNATSNAAQPVNIAGSGTQMVGQGFNTAISGNNSAGNLYGTAANVQNQANQADNALWGGVGGAAGTFLGAGKTPWIFSDKNMKDKKRPVKGEIALACVNKMPVKKWSYKADSQAADGGKEHVGPMAQDVQAAMGEKTAPGGKVVNVADVAGITLAAVQHLSKKVDQLARKRA